MKLPDFLEELNQSAEKAFGENAKSMIDSLLYAKLPPKLKRSVNMARLENGTYEEIVAHLERELELNALEESRAITICCPMASTQIKTPNAHTARRRVTITKTARNSRRKRKRRTKTVKNLSVQLTHRVTHVAKRTTQPKGAGKALAPTCDPKGCRQNKLTEML